MKQLCLALIASLLVVPMASARSRKGSAFPKDPSRDFSSHFDEEVKWDREHPKPEADEDAASASNAGDEEAPKPRRKKATHKKKRSHKKAKTRTHKAKQPAADTADDFDVK